jgi:thymidylate synthase (FAD)
MLERVKVDAMDAILGQKLNVLDHGFIRVVDYMGDDAAVVQAARVSYGSGTKTVNEDQGLINYLMRKWHTTPFEMCELKIHVKLPIFVARQWVRHRTASINEYSARYSVMEREFYVPEPQDVQTQSVTNKQGRDVRLPVDLAEEYCDRVKINANEAFDEYKLFLDYGVARELARIDLPLGTYTEWYWKVNLHNLMHFLQLRTDPHAQWEIRQYADVICNYILPKWVPMVTQAYAKYRAGAVSLSSGELWILKKILRNEFGSDLEDTLGFHKPADMSDNELRELQDKFREDTDD